MVSYRERNICLKLVFDVSLTNINIVLIWHFYLLQFVSLSLSNFHSIIFVIS